MRAPSLLLVPESDVLNTEKSQRNPLRNPSSQINNRTQRNPILANRRSTGEFPVPPAARPILISYRWGLAEGFSLLEEIYGGVHNIHSLKRKNLKHCSHSLPSPHRSQELAGWGLEQAVGLLCNLVACLDLQFISWKAITLQPLPSLTSPEPRACRPGSWASRGFFL